jgi:cell division septal protein FtsQ
MANKARRHASKGNDGSQVPSEPRWRLPPPKPRSQIRRSSGATFRLSPGAVLRAGRRAAQFVRHLRPRSWLWLGLPVLAIVIFGIVRLFSTDLFFVYDAEIAGNQRVPTELIYAAADIDQKNIFWIRPGVVQRQGPQVPGVASASVQVRLPHRVAVLVQEREPMLIWQTDSLTVWIATDGAPMPMTGTPPTVVLVDPQALAWGLDGQFRKRVAVDVQILRAQRPDLAEYHYGAAEGLYFRTPEGWNVYLGEGDIAAKLTLLQEMRSQIQARSPKPTVVDLRIAKEAYLR